MKLFVYHQLRYNDGEDPFKRKSLRCPNCNRKMPYYSFRRRNGCGWCVPETPTPYCDGYYD